MQQVSLEKFFSELTKIYNLDQANILVLIMQLEWLCHHYKDMEDLVSYQLIRELIFRIRHGKMEGMGKNLPQVSSAKRELIGMSPLQLAA
jgi:hypothetical protein